MNVLCITNRKLCERSFPEQIKYIASMHPWGIILREKDLSLSEYEKLSLDALDICSKENIPLFLHGIDTAEPDDIIDFIIENNATSMKKFSGVHLSMGDFKKVLIHYQNKFQNDYSPMDEGLEKNILHGEDVLIGVSAHSLEDALFCEKHGAAYITASHIFTTDCKKGLPPKGIPFLKEICENTKIPVFALGGINRENAAECIIAGAYGVSVMSECMKNDFNIY